MNIIPPQTCRRSWQRPWKLHLLARWWCSVETHFKVLTDWNVHNDAFICKCTTKNTKYYCCYACQAPIQQLFSLKGMSGITKVNDWSLISDRNFLKSSHFYPVTNSFAEIAKLLTDFQRSSVDFFPTDSLINSVKGLLIKHLMATYILW